MGLFVWIFTSGHVSVLKNDLSLGWKRTHVRVLQQVPPVVFLVTLQNRWKRNCGSQGGQKHRESITHWINWTGIMGVHRNRSRNSKPSSVCAKSSGYMLWLLTLSFRGTPGSRSGSISDCLFPALGTPFTPIGLALPALIYLVLLFLVVPCSVDVPLSPSLFLGMMGGWIWGKGKVEGKLEE